MSWKRDDRGSAFPHRNGPDGSEGMSLRDWFAGQALVGIADHFELSRGEEIAKGSIRVISRLAYEYADAMLAERGRERQS
ncbi:MAG: hypothetical protein AB7I42_26510 [Bradyrhizobium sp.]|uniref:hypothetical protein n=1 Tax=Bradyrhizobium sp. TaxID=376 RepID=UPI003D0B8BC8